MTTFPLPTLAPTIDENGITSPSYPDILQSMTVSAQTIYGEDIVLDSSSQDGEFLAIFANAQNDTNNAVIGAYRSFSPTTAQRDALSANVKLNGLARLVPSNSQVTISVVGVVGTQINNGVVGDNLGLGTRWALPALVTIPIGGTIDVTASCTVEGDVAAAPGTLTEILTPTRGWQSATNVASATPGDPVESDATLRRRQSESVALPSISLFDGVLAGLKDLTGVDRAWGYDNDTNAPDGNGIPAHSISMIIEGGVLADIALVILNKKGPGTGTYGTTTQTVLDKYGVATDINFFELTLTTIYLDITITALTGYLSSTEDLIKQALAYYVSNGSNLQSQGIGETVYYNRLWSPANLAGTAAQIATGLSQAELDAASQTFDISALTVGTSPSPVGVVDIPITFDHAASLVVANINVTVI